MKMLMTYLDGVVEYEKSTDLGKTRENGISMKNKNLLILAVILIMIFTVYAAGVVIQQQTLGKNPSDIAINDAQGRYETNDTVLMNGFCFEQIVRTELLIYYFTDDNTGDGVGIAVLSEIELTVGNQYTIKLIYQPLDSDPTVRWISLDR